METNKRGQITPHLESVPDPDTAAAIAPDPVVPGEMIAIAAGDGWTAEVPAGEWAAMTLEEQTLKIVSNYMWHQVEPDPPPATERDRVLQHVDPALHDDFWHVWQSLPAVERRVLDALEVDVKIGQLPAGTLGECRVLIYEDSPAGWWHPLPRIVIDPAQAESPAGLRETLRHELAHASFRHVETRSWFIEEERAEFLRRTHEAHAGLMAAAWEIVAGD